MQRDIPRLFPEIRASKIHFFELFPFCLLYCGKERDRVHSNHYDIMLKKGAELLFFSTLEIGIAVASDVPMCRRAGGGKPIETGKSQ